MSYYGCRCCGHEDPYARARREEDEKAARAAATALREKPWLSGLARVDGLTLEKVRYALDGHRRTGDLADTPAQFTVAGTVGRGLHHWGPDCGPTGAGARNPWTKTVPVGRAARFPSGEGRLCACAQTVDWIPADARTELAILADARALTRPWRSAEYSTARRGYTVAPYDHWPVTSGALADLADDAATYAEAHPEREHMVACATTLERTLARWTAMCGRLDDIADADPHTAVLRWQAARRLPTLTGSPKQVRWAEQIRYDRAHDDEADWFADAVEEETDAVFWIIDEVGARA